MLKPSDIADDVLSCMHLYFRKGKGKNPLPCTAYQVLERLKHLAAPAGATKYDNMRDQLIAERGMPGLKSSSKDGYASSQVVSDALEMLANRGFIEITYFDTEFTQFMVADKWITPGYTGHAAAHYRLL